jgi:biopolymer transport protein ExbD/biopolymer transport protein TolR
MAFLRKKREEPRIDLTPMVDVVFLLLIFFMISTTFVDTAGISIKLPESSSQQVAKEPKELKVYLSKEGEIYFKEERLSLEAFKGRLIQFGPEAGEMTFLLLADRETRHGRVVSIMDVARQFGFKKLAIATEGGGNKP